MNELLKKGFWVKTISGETATVEKFLAEGDRSRIYIVDYKEQEKVLKWYKKECLGPKPAALYESIKRDVDHKPSSHRALWPLDITEYKDGTFGYIMDHCPEDYDDLIKEKPHYLEAPEPGRDDDHGIEER